MKYALLIYDNENHWDADKTGADLAEVVEAHGKLIGELGPVFTGGAGLKPTMTATTVRVDGGGARTVHDGPFAETKEQLGGFYLVDVAGLDEAIAIAKRIPAPYGGSVEIRPFLQQDGNA